LIPVAVPSVVFATSTEKGLCEGANLQVGSGETCTINEAEAQSNVNSIIETVINIFSLVVGVVAVIMIIIGGLKYITSSGDSGNITGAKNTILYAIVGLVVVALAQIIVRFVLTEATPTQ
jgi:cytochrome bd-type quinol oxidase subunit 2